MFSSFTILHGIGAFRERLFQCWLDIRIESLSDSIIHNYCLCPFQIRGSIQL